MARRSPYRKSRSRELGRSWSRCVRRAYRSVPSRVESLSPAWKGRRFPRFPTTSIPAPNRWDLPPPLPRRLDRFLRGSRPSRAVGAGGEASAQGIFASGGWHAPPGERENASGGVWATGCASRRGQRRFNACATSSQAVPSPSCSPPVPGRRPGPVPGSPNRWIPRGRA